MKAPTMSDRAPDAIDDHQVSIHFGMDSPSDEYAWLRQYASPGVPEYLSSLMLATVQQAISDLTLGTRREQEDARQWFLSPEISWAFSFRCICQTLGFSPPLGWVPRVGRSLRMRPRGASPTAYAAERGFGSDHPTTTKKPKAARSKREPGPPAGLLQELMMDRSPTQESSEESPRTAEAG